MKGGSWSSFVAAGAIGADYGVPDDDPAPPIAEPDDDIGRLQELGYRACRDTLAGGRWFVAKWGDSARSSIGEAIGGGATAIEAWDAACRWAADRDAAERDAVDREVAEREHAAHAEHLRHLAEFDRWEGMTDREREDEIRRAMG